MDQNTPETRIDPLQVIIDALMIAGIFFLIWNALYTAGLAPIPPLGLFKEFDPQALEAAGQDLARHYLFTYALTFAGLVEYPALLLVTKSVRERVTKGMTASKVLLQLRFAFMASVWIYILVLNLVMA